jgi:5-methylcytosine-specific restriction endonuclease McrA
MDYLFLASFIIPILSISLHPAVSVGLIGGADGPTAVYVTTKIISLPFCTKYQELGELIKATVVDHIKPHRGDKILFWDQSNWQPLCKKCHDHKTKTEDKYQEYKY